MEPTENNYSKYLDIQSPLIDASICNLLLRENSQLRQWYRSITSSLNREIFGGMSKEGVWRLVKDLKVTDEFMTLARLDREFEKGRKSQFDVVFPNANRLELAK